MGRHHQARLFINRFLNDYVFKGSRLGSHPELFAFVGWVQGSTLAVTESTQHHVLNNRIPLDRSISGIAYKSRKSVTVSDVNENGMFHPCYNHTRSELAVPLLTDTRRLGVLNIESLQANSFTGTDLEHAELLALLLALANGRRLGAQQATKLRVALKRKREELGLAQAAVEPRVGSSRFLLGELESSLRPSSLELLYEWCRTLGLVRPREASLVSVIDLTPRLLDLLREEPSRLRQLTPEQFEAFVADRLDRIGYDVTLTGATSMRDGGIDLIAVPKQRTVGSFLLAGQIKHHRGTTKVTRPDVDRLLAWKDSPFRLGMLITNTFFTRDALWLASRLNHRDFLRLRDFDDLKRWIKDNFFAEEECREIPDSIFLAPGIRVQTPKAKLRPHSKTDPPGS